MAFLNDVIVSFCFLIACKLLKLLLCKIKLSKYNSPTSFVFGNLFKILAYYKSVLALRNALSTNLTISNILGLTDIYLWIYNLGYKILN